MNKKQFCLYLEDTAAELRALASTRCYLDDVCASLIDHTKKFWAKEEEENRIKGVNDE